MWIILALTACGTAPPSSTPSAAASVLEKADAADGTVDKTVSKCTGCGLGMQGDPAHAVEHEGYELHFCSDTCRSNFEEDPEAGIERLKSVVDED